MGAGTTELELCGLIEERGIVKPYIGEAAWECITTGLTKDRDGNCGAGATNRDKEGG